MREDGSVASSPLWACLMIAWLASIGTGIGWNGVFFIAEQAYGFGREANLVLGALMGVVYICGAIGAGRFVRFATVRFGISQRAVMIWVLVGMALVSLVPGVVKGTLGLWVFAGGFLLLSGIVWPVIESFFAGGRSGAGLRSATGLFNIAWSSAIIVTMLGIAPTLEETPRVSFVWLSAAHWACAVLAMGLLPNAGIQGSAAHGHTPEELALYRRLLVAFRIGLFVSYVLMSSLSPMLPEMLAALGVAVSLKTVLTSAMLISRTGVFVFFERTKWWHGRWRMFWGSAGVMFVGFVASHLFGAGAVAGGADAMTVALAVFGVGLGGMYAGAIYYAMETSGAKKRAIAGIESGGAHEAMIGLGYTLGPLVALLVLFGM